MVMMMVPIEVTLLGIETDVSPDKAKADSPNGRVSVTATVAFMSKDNDDDTNSSDTSRNSNQC